MLSRVHPSQMRPVPPDRRLGPVWIFWAQGLADAPLLVRACVDSIRRYTQDREVRVLSADDVAKTVALPSVFVRAQPRMGWTAFSDALRLALLVQHGGTWFDANVLLTATMPDDIRSAPLVVPSYPHVSRIVATWFLHARAGDPLLSAWLAALAAYWESDPRKPPYYHLHYIAEALAIFDAEAEAAIAGASQIDAPTCLRMKRALNVPLDLARWKSLTNETWMHKLSHKVAHGAHKPGTLLHEIESGRVLAG